MGHSVLFHLKLNIDATSARFLKNSTFSENNWGEGKCISYKLNL